MPFTPSHAVVALPFLRTPLIPAAIAVGAMTPDLPLFVRGMFPGYARTHDFVWLPLTVLMALALLLLWRCVFRPAARELAPRFLSDCFPGEWDQTAAPALRSTFGFAARSGDSPHPGASSKSGSGSGSGSVADSPLRKTALLVLSLVLGVVTHIVWDLFTHEGRAGTELFPILNQAWGPLVGYKWVQHGSSVVALMVLAIAGAIWLQKRPRIQRPRVLTRWVRVSWWLSLPTLLAGALVWGMLVFGPFTDEWTVQHLAYRVLPSASGLFGVATALLCVGVQLAGRRARK